MTSQQTRNELAADLIAQGFTETNGLFTKGNYSCYIQVQNLASGVTAYEIDVSEPDDDWMDIQ